VFADRLRLLEMIGNHVAVQAFKQRAEPRPAELIFELRKKIQGRAIRPNGKALGANR